MKKRDHYSHSSLSQFDCPRFGCLSLLVHEVRERNIYLTLGSAFHDLCATCYHLDDWNERAMISAWPRVLSAELEKAEKEGWTKTPDKRNITQAYEDGELMISNLFKNHAHLLRPAFRDHRGLWVENKVVVYVDGIEVIGYLDMVLPDLENPGSVIIYDFKTGKHLPEESDDETVSTYKDQMDLYALACRFYGLRVSRMTLVFPRLGKEISYKPSLEGFNRQRNRAVKVAGYVSYYEGMIVLGESHEKALEIAFPPLPNEKRCHWCSFKDGCVGPKQLEEKNRLRAQSLRDSLIVRNKDAAV